MIICLRSIVYANDKVISHKANIAIPEVAMLTLQHETNSNSVFSLDALGTAGEQLNFDAVDQSSVWLNYSSVVAQNQKRKVTATLMGEIPNGIALKVKTLEESNPGIGEIGTSNGSVILSNSPSDIINGIGSCYTGSGVQKGHHLVYELEIDNKQFYQNKEIHDISLSVVYTLTDDN